MIFCETRRRSLIKSVSFRIIEVIFTSMLLSLFVDAPIAVGLSVASEGICFTLHYIGERVWNKISYGRYIKET